MTAFNEFLQAWAQRNATRCRNNYLDINNPLTLKYVDDTVTDIQTLVEDVLDRHGAIDALAFESDVERERRLR